MRLISYFVPAGPETLNDPPNVTLSPCLSLKGCGERLSDWIFTGTLSSIIGKVDIISTKLQLGAKTNPAIPGTVEKKSLLLLVITIKIKSHALSCFYTITISIHCAMLYLWIVWKISALISGI